MLLFLLSAKVRFLLTLFSKMLSVYNTLKHICATDSLDITCIAEVLLENASFLETDLVRRVFHNIQKPEFSVKIYNGTAHSSERFLKLTPAAKSFHSFIKSLIMCLFIFIPGL